ncbi:MAG: hydantoin utilization protein A [Acidiferrobacteraceae bacterium]|nr:hydantoin utilization protein A [Acidiferrobacteraceae bacterium]|tara:strand:+ start:176 stop:2251 length:2076 start_codon:yes stop_codon:yes gene_type:complete
MTTWTLGIDVGGTFTDIVAICSDGAIESAKVPSTSDQSEGVFNSIEKIASRLNRDLGSFLSSTELIVHGTTVSTNALLEYQGVKTGLITTEGFRDELEFRRAYKESVFNPRLAPPHAIVPRYLRLGVKERIDHTGKILTPLDVSSCRDAINQLKSKQVESIAICCLFSFVNPTHELHIADLVREIMPEVYISLSSEILPEIREFERTSTTVVNAYVGPLIAGYLDSLHTNLRKNGFTGELFVMQSNGGVQTIAEASKRAVDTLLSGPAGGVTASAYIGRYAGYPDLITVDMGGTSYDVSVIQDLQPTVTTETWIGRYRTAVPMLDIHTIGAGGGSIAWIDEGGGLQVGPRSAGATPGPACYGRGGDDPTVTDADVVLGYIDPHSFLGGEMVLDADKAENAIASKIGEELGLSTIDSALAITDIINNNMSNAMHFVTTKRGYDPRDFTLLAMGGAGSVHAGRQAEDLGIATVIVPNLSPVFCALGDGFANLKVTETKTYYTRADDLDLNILNSLFREMELRGKDRLSNQATTSNFELRRIVAMRYVGEVHEVPVPIRSRTLRITSLNITNLIKDFHRLHEKIFAHKDENQSIEILTLRLELTGIRRTIDLAAIPFEKEDSSHGIKSDRQVYFSSDPINTTVYDGKKLKPGNFIPGPAIIEQWGTTIVIYPGQEVLIDSYNNCVIEIGSAIEL